VVRCDCGSERTVAIYALLDGVTVSCGCRQRREDGFPRSHPLYGTWKQMLRRCENPESDSYHRYGGRGIKVCERWHDPWLFAADIATLGRKPEGATLDRRDNDGDYELSNACWSARLVQQRNRQVSIAASRRRVQVRAFLAQGHSTSQIARALGVPRYVAADDIAWLRELDDRRALEEELRAARERIAELERELAVRLRRHGR
jgi:hypothetical protein